jgi:transketolase
LRDIPKLWVVRPADANETTVAWEVALERADGPVALLLSRQNIPVLDRDEVAAADGLRRGAYVLWDSSADATPELILISTGAEVPTTLHAGQKLATDGLSVRVVSMPCFELFEAQSREYRDEVLPPASTARLAVEPGSTISWWKWVGLDGDVLGLDRFGASAPGSVVLEHLGFTDENIATRARALLDRTAARTS